MFLCATCIGAEAGGPWGAVIGGLIDLGALLGGIFGGGGGHTPSLENFPFPNQFPSGTPSGGPLGPNSNGADSDQSSVGMPIAGSSDSWGTGGLFGGGNTNPFIFSFADQQTQGDVAIDNPFFYAVVKGVHRASPVGDARFIGGWYVASAATAVTAMAAYDISLVQAGRFFGTRLGGNQPLLNTAENLRIGWSYIRSTNEYVFRIGGRVIKAIRPANPHLNLWPPWWWLK